MAQTRRVGMQNEKSELPERRGFRIALPLWVARAHRGLAQRFYLSAQRLNPQAASSCPFGIENHCENLKLVFTRSCGIN
jgi:hypothetical protein